jgi:hypothetical protein
MDDRTALSKKRFSAAEGPAPTFAMQQLKHTLIPESKAHAE